MLMCVCVVAWVCMGVCVCARVHACVCESVIPRPYFTRLLLYLKRERKKICEKKRERDNELGNKRYTFVLHNKSKLQTEKRFGLTNLFLATLTIGNSSIVKTSQISFR